jgi:hypothetical protein
VQCFQPLGLNGFGKRVGSVFEDFHAVSLAGWGIKFKMRVESAFFRSTRWLQVQTHSGNKVAAPIPLLAEMTV